MDLLNLFRNANQVETFSAGQAIFRVGDPGKIMYVLLKGEVELSLHDKVFNTITPGEMLGELSLVDHTPRSADAVAKTDCVLAPVDERHFLFLVQETPYFALHVMSVIAERLRRRTEEAVR